MLKKSLILYFFLFLFAGCEDSELGNQVSNFNSPGSGGSGLDIRVEDRPDLGRIQALRPTPVLEDLDVNDLAPRIQYIAIDESPEGPSYLNFTLKLESEELLFVLPYPKDEGMAEYKTTNQGKTFTLHITCLYFCDQAAFEVISNDSTERVSGTYLRRTEFLTSESESLEGVDPSSATYTLLQEAIEYRFPVIHHYAKLSPSGLEPGLIRISRPDVDRAEPDLDRDNIEVVSDDTGVPNIDGGSENSEGSLSEVALIERTEPGSGEVVIETDVSRREQDVTLPRESKTVHGRSTEPKRSEGDLVVGDPDVEPDGDSTGALTKVPLPPIPKRDKAPALALTSDPFKAYGFSPPSKLVSGSVEDPVRFKVLFEIPNAENQQPLEPAFRIAAVSEAFVKQGVKVYKNACNIMTRALMYLSGYTRGRNYLANDFHLLFTAPYHRLDTWRLASFSLDRSKSKAEGNKLELFLATIPDYHAVVIQVDRNGLKRKSGRARSGHTAILFRKGGQYFIYDASYRSRAPGARVVDPAKLIRKWSGNYLKIFALPGLSGAEDV